MKKFFILNLVLSFFVLANCQNKKEMNVETQYNIEISHPIDEFRIEPVTDKIFTLEDTNASLPYGASSGKWASSGKFWTEQQGTPIGVDIVYAIR